MPSFVSASSLDDKENPSPLPSSKRRLGGQRRALKASDAPSVSGPAQLSLAHEIPPTSESVSNVVQGAGRNPIGPASCPPSSTPTASACAGGPPWRSCRQDARPDGQAPGRPRRLRQRSPAPSSGRRPAASPRPAAASGPCRARCSRAATTSGTSCPRRQRFPQSRSSRSRRRRGRTSSRH